MGLLGLENPFSQDETRRDETRRNEPEAAAAVVTRVLVRMEGLLFEVP